MDFFNEGQSKNSFFLSMFAPRNRNHLTMRNARIFVEKKPGFDVEAVSLKETLNHNFNLNIRHLRQLVVYDIFNVDDILLAKYRPR